MAYTCTKVKAEYLIRILGVAHLVEVEHQIQLANVVEERVYGVALSQAP